MIEEELRKKAEDYAEEHAFRVPYDGSNKFYDDVDFKASKEGYLAGAEPREKQIAKLEAQIEKMKADVKQGQSYWNSGEMQYGLYQRLLDKWEIKEK